MATTPHTVLLTGFPSNFLARRLLDKLLASDPEARVICVTPRQDMDDAEILVAARPLADRQRIDLQLGDPSDMDLGMSGKRFLALASSIHTIHHCACVIDAGVPRALAERINVGGTGEILELAEAAPATPRLCLWSTATVSGRRSGRVLESELTRPPSFHNVVEETRFRAERMVREAMEHIPTTIMRPSIIVGDSKTGEIDRMEGPYLLILLMLGSPVDLRVPLPGRGDVALNLVPIDYVVNAGYAIARDPRSVGRTFHLVDENPPSARRVFELIAEAAGRPGPVGSLPTHLTTALLRTPGLDRISHIPRSFLEQLATDVTYDARNARELLAHTDLKCPPAESYLPVMVDYVNRQQRGIETRQERWEHEADDVLGDA